MILENSNNNNSNRRHKKKPKKKKKRLRRIILIVILALLGLIAAAVLAVTVLFSDNLAEIRESAEEIAMASTLEEYVKQDDTVILDADGNEIFSVNTDTRVQVSLDYDEIPEDVINAFVAVEDQSFWENEGYDIKGIIRVVGRYVITHGSEAHGASTITQQLARGLYLDYTEVTAERKITEIILSGYLTQIYSKEEIITAYVNSVYFANNFYGIEAASKGYFGKKAKKLSLAEAAYLCAIPNSPTYYDPWENPDNTKERQEKILDNMLECGYITEKEYEEALDEKIKLQSEKKYNKKKKKTTSRTYAEQTMASYALNCAVKWKMEEDGFEFLYEWDSQSDYESYREEYSTAYSKAREELYEGGYTIKTSLDADAQEKLQTAVDEALSSNTETDEDSGRYTLQGAATCIDNDTGLVVAVAGGRSQDNVTDEYNRAFQAYRQPGSSIKPLAVYTPAFMTEDEDGNEWSADSTLKDISVTAANEAESQEELESLTGSSVTLRYAVEQSKNGPALYLFARVGVRTGLSYLTEMGFDKIVPGDYTIAAGLGGLTYGVTTEQMAGAYYTLYNGGKYRETTCITGIYDGDGEPVYEEADAVRVYEKTAAQEMTDVLKGVVTSGTAASMGWNSSSIEAAGKTGTTNDYYDHWFCGYTPYYTIAVWIGEDDPEASEYCRSNTYTGKIWKDAMEALCEGKEDAEFDLSAYEGESEEKDYGQEEPEEDENAQEQETEEDSDYKAAVPDASAPKTKDTGKKKTENKSDNGEEEETEDEQEEDAGTEETSP